MKALDTRSGGKYIAVERGLLPTERPTSRRPRPDAVFIPAGQALKLIFARLRQLELRA
jgi:hypothetical protein